MTTNVCETGEKAAPKTVKFKANGRDLEAVRESSLLEALLDAGIPVPHLCHHWAVEPYGACRLCLVEVKKGRRTKLTTSCNYPVLEGIEVTTHSEKIVRNRKMVMELLLARAPGATELVEMAGKLFGMKLSDVRYKLNDPKDRCILCGLCVRQGSGGH
jgi:bidirectional [NiFe] hydrogenase diaphorase subunit